MTGALLTPVQLEGGVGEGAEDLLPLQHVDVPQPQGERERGLGAAEGRVTPGRLGARTGPEPDQSWTRTEPELDKNWTRTGPELDQNWTRTGPELPTRSHSTSRSPACVGGSTRTHPVDEALEEPLGGVDPRHHLLPVLGGGGHGSVSQGCQT